MRRRIFFKLLAAIVMVVLVAAAMLDISQQHILHVSLQHQLTQSMEQNARELGRRITDTNPENVASLALEEADTINGRVTIVKGGQIIADSIAAGSPDSAALNLVKTPAMKMQGDLPAKTLSHGVLYVTVPAGEYVIRIGHSLREMNGTLHLVRQSLLWATLLALLAAILLAALLAHFAARRLARIVEFAHKLARGDFSVRIGETARDEIGAVAIALDATAARVEAVFHTLEDSRKEIEAVLDSMEEAVIAVDAQSRIHWTNRVMQRLLTATRPKLIQPGTALVQTIRDPDLLACVEQSLHQRIPSHGRAYSVVPGRIFDVSAAPMGSGSAVVVLHDMTEIDRMEKTRRDFIANVSHELRTPLTSISGYAEMMLDEDVGLTANGRDSLSIICRNAARMTRLTDDLLALARIESGEYKLNRKPIEVKHLIDEAAVILTGLLMESHVVLERGEMVEARVLADADAILQVLSNLMENAIKYGAGKQIIIRSRIVEEMVEFSVQDFGAGIGSEHLSRIFERFYRVDKARSRESGGTGLGLSIAKHIILAHGGTIWAESELNRGSTFSFVLPVALESTVLEADATRSVGP